MIHADKAHRLMQLYEADYDNYVSKLKGKAKAAETDANAAKAAASKAGQAASDAQNNKGSHLAQKAKDLIQRNGGLSGISDSVKNVMKYVKGGDNQPADYAMNIGKENPAPAPATPAETILGMPPMVAYAGGSILLLAALFGLSKLVQKKNTPQDTKVINDLKTMPHAHPLAVQ